MVARGMSIGGMVHPAPSRGRVSLAALWFGLAGGPAAWSVQTLVNLPVAAHGCYPRLYPLGAPTGPVRAAPLVVSALALVVSVAAAVVAWRSWARTREEHQDRSGRGREHEPQAAALETGEGRTRFMAVAGVMSSLTFLLVIALHMVTIVIVDPCW